MTKGVKVLIGTVIIIFAAAVVLAVIGLKPSESTWVDIVQNNKVIYHLDLSEEDDRTFRVDFPDGGWNDIQIKDGRISIVDSDCPDHTCIKTGELRSENIPIVCLPHKLVIRFSDEGAGE